MNKTFTMTAMAALMALPMLAASSDASASCQGRKNTGTAIGAIGGALLGNSISRGGGGAVVGGLGGAVAGHEIAKSGCGASRTAYHRSRSSRNSRYAYDDRTGRKVYYDQHGNPVPTASEYRR